MSQHPSIKPQHYKNIYDVFQASISRFDCGRKCAPLNDGEPVCCSTQHAVPVVHRSEWQLLKSRTEMWRRFKPYDAATRKIVGELHHSCAAIECAGARNCERDNRSLACRAFPFFPYLTREGAFVGLAYYWDFEDRCWVISNLNVVDQEFVRDFVAAYELLFQHDPEEFRTFRDHSASMRRVFARRRQAIPLIGRDGGYFKVLRGGAIKPAKPDEFRKHGPFRSERAYRKALAESQAEVELIAEP